MLLLVRLSHTLTRRLFLFFILFVTFSDDALRTNDIE